MKHELQYQQMEIIFIDYLDSETNLHNCVRSIFCSFSNQFSLDVLGVVNIPFEEVDTSVIPHLQYNVSQGYQKFVVAWNVKMLLFWIYVSLLSILENQSLFLLYASLFFPIF